MSAQREELRNGNRRGDDQMTEACAKPHPDAAQVFIEAAEALAPLIARHKRALSAGPDIPLEIVQALEAAGLTRMWLPRNLGGAELVPVGYFV
jgi:indole-3-acetate monooxygenase